MKSLESLVEVILMEKRYGRLKIVKEAEVKYRGKII